MTTLDALSEQYGVPDFVKIDVEGYETNVLRGMSNLPAHLSFELTLPECIDDALFCVDHLAGLGRPLFNYSLGERMRLELRDWLDAPAMMRLLRERKQPAFGDVIVAAS